jgi:hypothetical protein
VVSVDARHGTEMALAAGNPACRVPRGLFFDITIISSNLTPKLE